MHHQYYLLYSYRSNDSVVQVLDYLYKGIGDRLPIIASGGVFKPEDAQAKLDAGASLVQVWTGFIYEGPGMVKNILQALKTDSETSKYTK